MTGRGSEKHLGGGQSVEVPAPGDMLEMETYILKTCLYRCKLHRRHEYLLGWLLRKVREQSVGDESESEAVGVYVIRMMGNLRGA